MRPIPSKSNLLSRLAGKLPITAVVDVGIRECTAELIKCFPTSKHFLFEPVTIFFEIIKKNYTGIDYELFPIALADENSEIYLVLTSLNNDGTVTHSEISDKKVPVDGAKIVACDNIDVRRFADLPLANTISPDFLLKVDVDGQDLNVIKGFGQKLSLASAIIIECTFRTALERMAYIESKGFQLYDIVDIVYYGPGIYQFDMVFVRMDLLTPELRPKIADFRSELWSPLAV